VAPSTELRGLVRSYGGAALDAEVEVHPGGHRTTTDEEGAFELALPAGHYEVRIEAPGYEPQRRKVIVEEGGVTVLNVELRRSAR
jgi:uncharacterized membrane protein